MSTRGTKRTSTQAQATSASEPASAATPAVATGAQVPDTPGGQTTVGQTEGRPKRSRRILQKHMDTAAAAEAQASSPSGTAATSSNTAAAVSTQASNPVDIGVTSSNPIVVEPASLVSQELIEARRQLQEIQDRAELARIRQQIEDLNHSQSTPPIQQPPASSSVVGHGYVPEGPVMTPPASMQYGHLTYPALQTAPAANPAKPPTPQVVLFSHLHGQGIPQGEIPSTQPLLKRFPALDKHFIADIFWSNFDHSKNLGRLCAQWPIGKQ
ncbi:MAG: hypothetical protein LQ343_008047 [Gyalolechia ehrenbergii]|nr:MAG: hypothetical protein LQ343_008047 [Gyalolechia ehrenbergii]